MEPIIHRVIRVHTHVCTYPELLHVRPGGGGRGRPGSEVVLAL